ncbi:uncharacterized protein LOC112510915 [Cynara cardunculus var. scolymus]|uniref:Uncharacterized protein n=1 Tax=Cynara cardunculus var. scolymus TaxID=59895 RepID=A0A103XWP5_CYNCS|nr:uncharacterized protein LOC112510915 [Cynara cardunculus var. scolymus]KVH98303.1 hypothetical protein Ccrd_023477 [Cynara cardunculus var. scolymus]
MWIDDFKRLRITQAEFNDYHAVDRKLYATLVFDLWRDPIEAIQMMAIWIWLERVGIGFPDLTRRILNLPAQWIDKIGSEALLCWACLDNTSLLCPSSVLYFPLTNMLLKKDLPIELFRKFREISIFGINEVINGVCANCLKDIWDGAITRNVHMKFLQRMATHEPVVPPQTAEVQPDNRTLFVTFSRGYPVCEQEVREFLSGVFGECIESFYMQEVSAGENALFAKIVLNHPSYIHLILGGARKAKFTINGKHVWVRKFIPRRRQ